LPIIFLARTTINVAFRIIYPFLPSIARGLGISLTAATRLITLRMVAGLGAPFLGSLADRYGRRRVMIVALALFALAGLLIAGVGTLPAAVIAFALFGITKVLYDPALHAFIGDQVPYRERGRAVGIVELSWSCAWLVGVPASGFLIERFGWRAPWAVLAGLALIGSGLTRAFLPASSPPPVRAGGRQFIASLVATWRDLLGRRSVVVLLLASFSFTMAIEVPFIVYGDWLETTFGLSLSTLGLASTVVGVAEATAELGATVVTDRLGKRRSVLLGALGLAASLLALPWLARLGLGAALAGVMLMMLSFEFGLVSLLPLASELAPEARASLLSLLYTAFSLSRILGAFLGGWLWRWQSIALQAGAGVGCALLAAAVLGWGMKELGMIRRGDWTVLASRQPD
jgi:predicted MFS family arabinose efflux permease